MQYSAIIKSFLKKHEEWLSEVNREKKLSLELAKLFKTWAEVNLKNLLGVNLERATTYRVESISLQLLLKAWEHAGLDVQLRKEIEQLVTLKVKEASLPLLFEVWPYASTNTQLQKEIEQLIIEKVKAADYSKKIPQVILDFLKDYNNTPEFLRDVLYKKFK